MKNIFKNITDRNNNLKIGTDSCVGLFRSIPTGIPAIDSRIVGLPPFVELYGPPESGKTTFALHVVATATKAGIPVVYLVSEFPAFDLDRAKYIGVDFDKVLITETTTTIETGFSMVRDILDSLRGHTENPLVVWDTLSVCPIEKEARGESIRVAERASIIRGEIRKLVYAYSRCNYLFLTHEIPNFKEHKYQQYEDDQVSDCGSGLKFHCNMRIQLQKDRPYLNGPNANKGRDILVHIRKSRTCNTTANIVVPLSYEKGFLPVKSLLSCFDQYTTPLKRKNNIYYTKQPKTGRGVQVTLNSKIDKDIYKHLVDKAFKANAPKWYHDLKKQLSDDCLSGICNCDGKCTLQKQKLGIL